MAIHTSNSIFTTFSENFIFFQIFEILKGNSLNVNEIYVVRSLFKMKRIYGCKKK